VRDFLRSLIRIEEPGAIGYRRSGVPRLQALWYKANRNGREFGRRGGWDWIMIAALHTHCLFLFFSGRMVFPWAGYDVFFLLDAT